MTSDPSLPGLIADIGGTNARFALSLPGQEAQSARVLACAAYRGPAEAAAAYLDQIHPAERPRRAAFAVASPITGDVVDMTNHPWTFSIAETRNSLGLDSLKVVNDFTAVALSIPRLGDADHVAVGGGKAVPGAPIAVIGPGTGLGVSALVPAGSQWTALATEGGHVTMAAFTEREADVLERLRRDFDHVSAERVISGPGLVNLYNALSQLSRRKPEALTPDIISERGLSRSCPVCAEALDMFFAMLGTVSGNLALSLGARGGVYIAGGIIPRMIGAFTASAFRRRFEDKGRFNDYLGAIPVQVITHPYPAFLGLAGLVEETVAHL